MTATLPAPRAIIFDWDNTLVDSWPCIHTAMNATLAVMGHDPWSMEDVQRRVALSLRNAFPDLFGARWEEARDIYYSQYAAIHMERIQPLAGAIEMLTTLNEMGIRLAVVSNKTGRFLRAEAKISRLGPSVRPPDRRRRCRNRQAVSGAGTTSACGFGHCPGRACVVRRRHAGRHAMRREFRLYSHSVTERFARIG